MTMIPWTRPMLTRFKLAHRAAREGEHVFFTFDGNDFDVDYAGYLIEYLEERFKHLEK